MKRIGLTLAVGVFAISPIAAGCATTVDPVKSDGAPTTTADVTAVPEGQEPALDSGRPIDGGTIVDPYAPELTVAAAGTASDLLPDLATEMSRLGSLIAENGKDDEALARIEQIWDRIRPEIEADHPELLTGLTATIEMSQLAVERTRPADADKAFDLLNKLVDQFTAPG